MFNPSWDRTPKVKSRFPEKKLVSFYSEIKFFRMSYYSSKYSLNIASSAQVPAFLLYSGRAGELRVSDIFAVHSHGCTSL